VADDLGELVTLLDLGSATGHAQGEPLTCSIVRALTIDDVPALQGPNAVDTPPQTLQALRHSHHQLAILLVQGYGESEAGMIVGYSPAYVTGLKADPTFAELIASYAGAREQRFADTIERMRGLGFRSLEELESRLESEPEKWTRRELMEMAELMLVKPQAARGASGGSAGPAAVNVNLKFITADAQAQKSAGPSEPVMDLDYEDLEQ
jgi:hypothetical protein